MRNKVLQVLKVLQVVQVRKLHSERIYNTCYTCNTFYTSGFTVIELLLSIGILTILFALTIINLGRLPSSSAQNAVYDVLISDIRSQQTRAMAGSVAQGIHFGTNSYTLIPSDFVVNLDPGLSFSDITFTNGDLNFAAGSGETTPGSFSIVNDQINETKVVNINKYGANY